MAQALTLYDVLALLGVIIATLGVVNTVMMNVFERRREIGGLRSMGMTRTQVIRMMLAESGAMGAIGGLFGLVLGFIYSKESLLGLQVLTGFRMDYSMPPVALIISLVIALVVSQVAAIYPAWYAANVRIIEAIQHE
jgi:putative ABC transport system permease protein